MKEPVGSVLSRGYLCEGELSATDTYAGHSLWSSELITVVGRGWAPVSVLYIENSM